jgi:hypothetical protein
MKNFFLITIIMLVCEASSVCQESNRAYQNGDFRFAFALPHFNTLSFQPGKQFRDVEYGFNGYSGGFEYSYLDKRFIAVGCAFVMTFEWFIPAPVNAEYNKIMLSSYINLTDNIILNSFTLGYGFSYSANTWQEFRRSSIGITLPGSKSYTNNNVGLTFNGYFRAGRTLHFGLIYQPSLVNLNHSMEFIYEHSISAVVQWRFNLVNLKNTRRSVRRI